MDFICGPNLSRRPAEIDPPQSQSAGCVFYVPPPRQARFRSWRNNDESSRAFSSIRSRVPRSSLDSGLRSGTVSAQRGRANFGSCAGRDRVAGSAAADRRGCGADVLAMRGRLYGIYMQGPRGRHRFYMRSSISHRCTAITTVLRMAACTRQPRTRERFQCLTPSFC
jgi:hypothetical protein